MASVNMLGAYHTAPPDLTIAPDPVPILLKPLHYPSAVAVDGDQALAVVWSADTVLAVPPEVTGIAIVNGTRSIRVGMQLARRGTVRTVDYMGVEVSAAAPVAGRCSVEVPVGGRAFIVLDGPPRRASRRRWPRDAVGWSP